jgi:hypothetical protein
MTTITRSASTRAESSTPTYKGAALGGIAFVVLNVASFTLAGAPPATDAPTAKVVAFFNDHASAIKTEQLLGALGVVGLFWWFGAVAKLLRQHDDGAARLTTVAAVGLAVGVTLALLCGALYSTAAIRIDSLGEGVQLLWTLAAVTIATAGLAMGTFITATCVVNQRSRLFPTWTNYLGGLAALAFLVGSVGITTDSNAVNSVGYLAFVLMSAWIVCVSVPLWRRAV